MTGRARDGIYSFSTMVGRQEFTRQTSTLRGWKLPEGTSHAGPTCLLLSFGCASTELCLVVVSCLPMGTSALSNSSMNAGNYVFVRDGQKSNTNTNTIEEALISIRSLATQSLQIE